MTNEHPITPPTELVEQWCYQDGDAIRTSPRWYQILCDKAARWGADQELEACVQWISERDWTWTSSQLRSARRPKPPSLKEQALDRCNDYIDPDGIIRRALELLPE
jgi:hypothetical protein